ncbi:MAG: tetratricopeptide repeat protein [Bacteroidales bacterium]|nr:tetratricopeptide repeat protein [Bacteroidales bacterium]
MAGSSNRFSRFWQELRRRKTDRVIVFYAATAFGILELVDIVAPALSLPDWTMTFVLILLLTGFPVFVVFSWVFNITPAGIEKTKSRGERKKPHDEKELKRWKSSTLAGLLIILGLVVFSIARNNLSATEIRRMEKTIAVIPFDNYCIDDEFEFLGDAIPNAIITHLAISNEFEVVSFTAVSKYKGADKPSIRQIGKDHNVNFVVEGSIEIINEKVSINVQLINARTDYHIWANEFEGEKKELQAIRAEINLRIAEELKIALSPEEIEQIERSPTSSTEAWLTYISGNVVSENVYYYLILGNRYADSISFENAIKMYGRAIEYDPLFSLAYAKRAITYAWGYYTRTLDESSIEKCKADIDKALIIDPDLTEALIALGFYHYYCIQDYQEALKHFTKASEQSPENWEPLFYMAMVLRRNGDWQTSQSLLTKVMRHKPQNALILTNIGLSYDYLRVYDSALMYHEKAIKLMPAWSAPWENKISALLLRDGSTEKARETRDTAILKTGNTFSMADIYFDIYDGKYDEALRKAEQLSQSDFNDQGEKFLLHASISSLLGEPGIAERYYKSALGFYKKQLENDPDNAVTYANLGLSYAGLKNKIYAIEAGEIAVNLITSDMMAKNDMLIILAQICVIVGEFEKATGHIEYLLENPFLLSVNYLKLDPVWKSLLDYPEFKKILLKYSSS